MSIVNRIRKALGWCIHAYDRWVPILCADDTPVGRQRTCGHCKHVQQEHYPDGH